MACPDVKTTSATEGGPSSYRTAKGNIRKRPARTMKELRKAITKEIFKMPLYNCEAIDTTLNPPLPRMTLSSPPSLSIPINSRANNLERRSDLEFFTNLVMPREISYGYRRDTEPSFELKQLTKGGHICFSGPAGSGKTTLLRVIARNSAGRLNGYDKINNVHIISPQLFQGDSSKVECLARHVIFSGNAYDTTDRITDAESKIMFDHARSHSEEYLLIFDSLDTLSQELNEIEDPVEDYDPHRKYLPLVHLKMLLKGKLLTGCRVVTSSRPHAIRNFRGDLTPSRVVSLLGFSRRNALEVLKLYSPNALTIFQVIENRPHFFSLFKEPVFLVYLVQIWEHLKSLDYMRATDVLTHVINCFRQGDHAKGDVKKLRNMQKLARGNLWCRKLDFDESNLKDYGLEIKDLTDICTNALDKKGRSIILRLTTGESPFMFSHQLIQEMLAAIDVVESRFRKFEEKIRIIHEPFFHKTRDFVYGLAFGKFGFSNSDCTRKHEALKKSIEIRFRRATPTEQLLIFETLAEAINDVGQFDLETSHGVNLSGILMNDWNLYCTGVAVSQFTVLQILHLEVCGLQLSHLNALRVGICRINRSQLQILSFSLNGNPGIASEKGAVEIACRIVTKCRVNDFNIGSCGLSGDSMSEMLEGLRQTKVSVLVLEGNRIGKRGMEIAGEIVKCCSVKDISLSGCATTFEEAEAFSKSASGSNINRLTVDHDINGRIVCGYGSAIRHCHLRVLQISVSALMPEDASRMMNCSSGGKISELVFATAFNMAQGPDAAPMTENNCRSICNLLPIVKEEIAIPVVAETKMIETLQASLNSLQDEGPEIKFLGPIGAFTLLSKKRQNLAGEDQRNFVGQTDSFESTGKEEDSKEVGTAAEEEEIAMEMESEYSNISNGFDTMAWLNKYRKHPDLVSGILATYGFSIHRYKMTDEDRHLVAEIFVHCPELKRFSFTYSEDLKPMLDVLIKVSNGEETSFPKAKNVCFAGYQRIDKELSGRFVEFVKLFKAEGLSLTSVNVSHDGLQTLQADLKQIVQTGHFKRLEIFHNPDISDKGWGCLADIALDFSNVPLQLSICYCDLKDKGLLAFKDALKSTKLGKIDVCGNRKLTESGFQTLGEIVKSSNVPAVTLQDCDLDVRKVLGFNSGCGIESPTLEIASLNVANNPNLGPDGVEEIKKTIQRFSVKNLNIGSCRLHDVDFDHQFESLDISGNPRCTNIPKLAKSVGKRLYMRNCMLNKAVLRKLASEMKVAQRKLIEIDVCDSSKQVDCDDVDFLVEVFKDMTAYITVAENVSIPTSEQGVNGMT